MSGDDAFDVAVIGAGLGGLSCAAYLARAGLRVFVAEKHMAPGGYATTFQRGPYRFESSLHMIDAVGPTDVNGRMFADLGLRQAPQLRRLPLIRHERWPEHTFDVPADLDAYLATLGTMFPEQVDGLARWVAFAREVHLEAERFQEHLPGTPAPALAYSHELLSMTADECLSRFLTDPALRAIIGHMSHYYGLSAQELSAAYFVVLWYRYHALGGYYPEGGSSALSEALAEQVRAHRGVVATRCSVTSILVERRRVCGIQCGEKTIRARAVVSSISPLVTFQKLLPAGLVPPRVYKRLTQMTLSCSACKCWVATDRPLSFWGIEAAETIWSDQLHQPPFSEDQLTPITLVAESLLDPTCVPEGHGLLSVIWLWPHWSKTSLYGLERKAYKARKEAIGQASIVRLEETLMPGLRDHVTHLEIATPRTFLRFSGNPEGALFGWEATPKQSTIHRPDVRSSVAGLYLASAWSRMGSGFTAAMMTGRRCAQILLHDQHQVRPTSSSSSNQRGIHS